MFGVGRALTVLLREMKTPLMQLRRQSDQERWSDPHSYDSDWINRAAFAASLIAPGSSVLDIGCGQMQLAGILPEGCTYFGADLAPIAPTVLRCDLNRREFPPGHYDYVTMLGLLGYLIYPAWALLEARRCAHSLIFSYKVANRRDFNTRRLRWREGYFNNFDEAMLTELLSATGWRVETVKTYEKTGLTRYDMFLCAKRFCRRL